MSGPEPAARLRIDKWLWAARFYKTRSLAAQAVEGGKAHLNGQRVKQAREVKVGDLLDVAIGDLRWTVIVRTLSGKRGPATQARELYEETGESLARREAALELRKIVANPAAELRGRPTKKDRRLIRRFTGD